MKRFLVFTAFFLVIGIYAQDTGIIRGKVIDSKTRETLPYVNVVVVGTQKGGDTNDNGEFEIKDSPLGYQKVRVSFVGYKSVISEDYLVTKEKVPYVVIELTEDATQLAEVEVKTKLFKKTLESPLSLQSLGVAEIERNPGGNRDVLRVIQSFPGVASNPGFRNDIIIRGGATSENKFYVDGIEVPVINHFQTQGATGGPVGIMNTDLIRKVDFYSSAFPSNRGNTLSSVIEFTQKTGNPDRLNARASLGTSDAGITLDGPLGKNTTFIVSARQSYLQFLFKLIKLPFLPTYNDFQFNIKTKLSDNSELAIIGLGAIDDFEINKEVNDGVTEEETLKRNQVILNTVPVNSQWNYTVGVNYKRFGEKATQQFIFSRNEWKNKAVKYFLNQETPNNLLLDYSSKEIENKFRFENTIKNRAFTLNLGFNLELAKYTNNTFQKVVNTTSIAEKNFSSSVNFVKYGLFGQFSKLFFKDRLGVSLGFRFDGIDYNDDMKNILNQFSPRVATTYNFTDKWSWNSSIGIYKQLPSYTVMGFRNKANELVNKQGLKYIESQHFVSGLEFKPNETAKITVEGFYKKYKDYPFSVRDQISLANLGADFGVVGNEEVISNSTGRAYGFEVLAQKKSYKGLYGIAAYTFVRSEFSDRTGNFIPSSWDNRHLLTITAGKKLAKNWEVGTKFRLVGGRPYTPYNYNASSIKANYDISNGGILDFARLNEARFDTYTQLDIRVDKTWYLKKYSINLYMDVQNVYASSSDRQPFLLPQEDGNGVRLTDPDDSSRYLLEEVQSTSGRAIPRIGVIVDF
ncbi:TonB-dependent receptor [Tenacibaculum sp. 190524A02b]|uniref:TonB-dependent receptor n=1 Tax=Tenacibaculum vairaonense TaxID=3137860 RepID=UPI0031FAD739